MTPNTPTASHSQAEPVFPPFTFNSPIQFPYQNLSPDLTHSSPNTNPTQTQSTTSLPNNPASSIHTFNERSSQQKKVMSQASRFLEFTEPRSRTLRESTQTQRKAERLWKANLPWDVTHCNPPSTGKQEEKYNALKSKLDYSFVIVKSRRATKRKKTKKRWNNFYRKREEPEKVTLTYKSLVSRSSFCRFPSYCS